MLKRIILIQFILLHILFAKDCVNYYNPEKFYEAPLYLEELIEENIKGLALFAKKEDYKYLEFKKENNTYTKKDSFIKLKEYIYPIQSQLWKYKVKNNFIEEFDISMREYYKLEDSEIANEINENFEGFWNDWIEDGYSMQLIPTHTLFRYKDYYFALSVFVYGVKGDASSLKHTVVNYHLKNYTKEVKTYLKCMK